MPRRSLWVMGYTELPVIFILYAQRVLGLDAGPASLRLAAFAVGAGAGMVAAGFVRRPRLHKPFLGLGYRSLFLLGCGNSHRPRPTLLLAEPRARSATNARAALDATRR